MGRLNKLRKLGVFVGAGISQGCGLPGWGELIDRLSAKVPKTSARFDLSALAQLDNITRTRILRELLGQRFTFEIGQSLYAEQHTLSPAVKALARLGADRICTYNFDDILEEALAFEGAAFQSATPYQLINNNFGGVNIYHVHGLLTSDMGGKQGTSAQIVFDESDYNFLYSDPYSWSNMVQLSMLMSGSCLFIGCSMRDPNLRRLLDTCRRLNLTHKHFAILQSPVQGKKGIERQKAMAQRQALHLELSSLSVEPIWIGPWSDIADILKRIQNRKNFNRQCDLMAAPVGTDHLVADLRDPDPCIT